MKVEITNTKRLYVLGNSGLFSDREILTAFLKQFRQKLGYYSIFAAFPAILTSLAQEAQADEPKKPEANVAGQTVSLVERRDKSLSKPALLRRRSNYLLPFQKGQYNFNSVLSGSDDCPGTAIPTGTYTAAAPFTDSGNTTGANNTVNLLSSYYYYYTYNAAGPDQIYSFKITGRGANPQIQVSATSATYKPMIYILDGRIFGCPAGTGNNNLTNWLGLSYAPSPGGAAILNSQRINNLPLNVPLHLFVDSEGNGANSSGPYTLRIQDVTIAPAAPLRTRFDFDGDGKADLSVFRPSDGVWYLNRSQAGSSAAQFGLSTDKIVPADYDGDGKTDIAVFRDGIWYLQRSTAGFIGITFGAPGDIPQPADFNNDGKAEIVLFRPLNGSWYIYDFINNQVNVVAFGQNGDQPVVGDYDGDSRADIAVFRPSDGFWYIQRSRDGFAAIQFGVSEDKPVPADYDGDGKTDVAVFRPSNGTWYLLRSQAGFTGFQFGSATDIPIPADYDGDGLSDAAYYRNGIWYLRFYSSEVRAVQFGAATDKPIPAAFLP